MKRTYPYIAWLSAICLLLSFASCKDRDEMTASSVSGNEITFEVAEVSDITRAADESRKHILYSEGSDTLLIETFAEENNGSFADGPQTKGYITTTANLDKFYATCFTMNGTEYFSDYEVTRGGSFATDRYWLNEPLTFIANSHQEDDLQYSVSSDGVFSGRFSYTLPVPDLVADPDATVSEDAAHQPDYVFAVAEKRVEQDNPVFLHFRHSFSAICFRIGTMPTGTIDRISINNAWSYGICSLSTDATTGKISFEWSGQKDPQNYVQTLGSKDMYPGMMANEDGIIFMMIPHDLENVEMEVDFTLYTDTDNPQKKTVKKKFSDLTESWDPNYRYIYKISMPEKIEVEVEDLVEENVKSNVEITNTGITASYIRAAIVGYWVDAEGNIVAPWKDTDGSFVWGSAWNDKWVKGNDGFYYHKQTVNPGDKTYPLFETYTLEVSPPMQGSSLKINIITQAVLYYMKDVAWPDNPLS